jgi:hypothetical protein
MIALIAISFFPLGKCTISICLNIQDKNIFYYSFLLREVSSVSFESFRVIYYIKNDFLHMNFDAKFGFAA